MNRVYAPGCALMVYKSSLSAKVREFLQKDSVDMPLHTLCCRHQPSLPAGTEVVNTCAGCDRRFREQYEGVSTISLWEVLASSDSFPFIDYGGRTMTIHDACPTRSEDRVHIAIRRLLERMNITIVEADDSRARALCCGDSYFGVLPVDEVKRRMEQRAIAMPVQEVVVYCVSCIKSMHIGGKTPRYMVDLLFGEQTEIGTFEPAEWHDELDSYIKEQGSPQKTVTSLMP